MAIRRIALVPIIATFALLLGACASPVSTSQESPAPEPSSPTSTPSVDEHRALDCAVIAESVLTGLGLDLVDPLGSTSALHAASAGGLYCSAAPTAAAATDAIAVSIAVMPAAVVAGAGAIAEGCGVVGVEGDGCTRLITLPDVTAEVLVLGPPTDSVTKLVDDLTPGITALLESGARPAAGGEQAAVDGIDCPQIDLSTADLPAALGTPGEWGGTDANGPITALVRQAASDSDSMYGCVTMLDGGYTIGLSTVPADPALIADARVIGDGDEIELASGRAAAVRVIALSGREFVRIVTVEDGVFLLMTVGSPEGASPALPLAEAAPILADAVAEAVGAVRG